MGRAVLFTIPLHGHTNPTLAVARALVDQGEQVFVFSVPEFQAKVEKVGAEFAPYQAESLRAIAEIGHLEEGARRLSKMAVLISRGLAQDWSLELPRARAAKPDYVLHDAAAPWGKLVAQSLARPGIAICTTIVFDMRVWLRRLHCGLDSGKPWRSWGTARDTLATMGNVFQARANSPDSRLWARDIFFAYEPLNIVCTARCLQPDAARFKDRFRFVGADPGDEVEPVDFPWEALRKGPVIHVALGTLFNRDVSQYQTFVEALAPVGATIVISTGQADVAGALGQLPENVIVRPLVPQFELLERCSLFVSHGGIGSLSKSLARGVPCLMVPQIGEQAIVARQVAAHGAGICLRRKELTVGRVRTAATQLLEDPSARRAASSLGEALAAAGGPTRAALLIKEHVRALGHSCH